MSKEFRKLITELDAQAEKEFTTTKTAVVRFKKVDAAKAQEFFISLSGYWKIIRLALKLVKIFTGAKADKKIDEIIAWGDENL